MVKIRTLSSKVGKALRDHNMINDGDRILIAYSGGKDSFALIKVLQYVKTKYNIKCKFKIISIDAGFDMDFEKKIVDSLKDIDLPYVVLHSSINKLIETKVDKSKTSCFLCARLRRGLIYKYAVENNYNKLALGHNLDDGIETFLLNLFYSNQISLLKPSYQAKDYPIQVIRPMIYVDQDLISNFIKELNFKPILNNCPLNKDSSKRLYFRKFLDNLKQENPKIKESALHAFKNSKNINFWKE